MERSLSVVVFIVDGLRPDGLEQAHTPNIDSILSTGAYTFRAETTMPTMTLPCMASMFLGTSPDAHTYIQLAAYRLQAGNP